jgi:hypothetical protein
MGVLITLNETTVINDGFNSSYTYTFPNGGYRFKDNMMALSSLTNYNSTVNISAQLNNNKLYYGWPVGPPSNGVAAVSATIPDGHYTISQLNAFFQSVMYANKHYFLTLTGNITYIMVFSFNNSQERVYLNTYNIGNFSSPQYTIPAGANWTYNSSSPLVQLIAGTPYELIGFPTGTYPTALASPDSIFSGTTIPEILAVKTVNIHCSIVANRTSIPNDLLYDYAPNEDQTTLNLYTPQADFVWVPITDGLYNEFVIELRDSLNNKLIKQSVPQMTLVLYIKSKDELSEKNI